MKAVRTIEIDQDRKCKLCGKGGAAQGGICLVCAAKNVKSGVWPVSECVRRRLKDIEAFLANSKKEMQVAYGNEGILSISMSIKVAPAEERNQYDTAWAINFVKDRVKVGGTIKVNPAQTELLFPKKEKGDSH